MKKLLVVFIFILININLYSNPVDTVLAKTIAKNYFEFLNPSRTNIEIKNTITIYYNGYPSYYIINFIDGGYITVSANDATVPILSYSYGGEYKENDFHNPAYLDWMENYSKEIDSVRIYNIPNDSTIQEWNKILYKNFIEYKSNKTVSPLIKTCWGQSHTNDGYCPGYNSLCPSDNDCDCDHCDAGCVAIAMAQIMKYWMHPVHATYQDYDWCNMHNVLNEFSTMTEVVAVAKLIRDCGDASGVNYCVAEWANGCATSLWPVTKPRNAFVDDFGYSDDANIDRRGWYSKKNWIKKLKEDLDNGRPIMYFAWPCPGIFWHGHYFIIDGYNNDKFHINWGWHGTDNAYYEMGELNPDTTGGSYNCEESAIFNLHPDWYIDCNSTLYVLQDFEYLIPILYYNPAAGNIIAGGGNNQLTIQSNQTVHYIAYNEIDLLDGFTVEAGSDFTAEIIPCPAECTNYNKSLHVQSNDYPDKTDFVYDTINYNEPNILQEINKELKFNVSPNPFTTSTTITFDLPQSSKVNIFITNIYGIKISEVYNNFMEAGSYNITLDGSDLQPGMYFFIMETVTSIEMIKIVKM